MLQNRLISRKTGRAVQVISQCRILPEGIEAVCYQEMAGDFEVFVLEKEQFEKEFCKTREKECGTDCSLPAGNDPGTSDLIRFLDADTYREKMKILEGMKDELDEHMLNNLAVSLDLSIEDGVDGYSFLMSELKIRSRFEGKRGERL